MSKTLIFLSVIALIQQINAFELNFDEDALLLIEKNALTRMSLSTQSFESVPMDHLVGGDSIDYDLENKCIFWSDSVTLQIRRQCNNKAQEILYSAPAAKFITLAYDWIRSVLYFANYDESRIEAIDLKPTISHRIVVYMEPGSKPFGLAVHPERGYLFWSSRKAGEAKISRANLDGTDVRTLVQAPKINFPNRVTIDFEHDKVLWTDGNDEDIGSCDFDGKNFNLVLDYAYKIPIGLAVYNNTLYWSDWFRHKFGKLNIAGAYETTKSASNDDVIKKDVAYRDVRVVSKALRSGKKTSP